MGEKQVVTVLRSGGDFRPEHVHAMQRQVAKHAPEAEFWCLSDVKIEGVMCLPLKHDWPGWWAKIELFRLDGGFLYTDLDNVILGPIDDMFTGKYTTQRGDWNALMYVPKGGFPEVYEEFKHAPGEHIAANGPTGIQGKAFGDAGFVAARVRGQYWEDVVPDQVVNICTVRGFRWPHHHLRLPGTERVLLCSNMYGRPWDMPEFRMLYA